MHNEAIGTASALWANLVERAGLTGKRGTRQGSYDRELIDHLQHQLFPGSKATLESSLAASNLSAEELLRAFLASLRPFAEMKVDILRMLNAAGAQHSGDSLPIRFNFDPENEPLDLLLKEFARQLERFTEVTVDVTSRLPTYTELWKIPRNGDGTVTGIHAPYPSTIPSGLRAWLDLYREKGTLSPLPTDWRTGRDDVDDRLSRVANVVNRTLQAFRKYASDHEGLRRSALDDEWRTVLDESGFTVFQLWIIESDYWPGAVARWLVDRREDVLAKNEDALQRMILEIDEILPATDETDKMRNLVRQLEEILDLPIWKYRHAVYAVWLGAQIYRSLSESEWSFDFHTIDGRLEFAFRGVHLATLNHARHPDELAWWTELGTDHDNLPSGHRKKGIQPDYRIRTNSRSVRDLLVIEAKQHLRSSTKEFAAALTDYAYACPEAVVVLANYGPVSERSFESLDKKLRERCFAVAHCKPDNVNDVSDLRSVLAHGILAALDGKPDRAVPAGEVRLIWGDTPQDLDLHLDWFGGRREHVFYDALDQECATLLSDVRTGKGPEIAFLKKQDGEFVVEVRQYSSDGNLAASGALVEIQLGYGVDRQTSTFLRPASIGGARGWIVCTVKVGERVIEKMALPN